jgi:hypothetical protein
MYADGKRKTLPLYRGGLSGDLMLGLLSCDWSLLD